MATCISKSPEDTFQLGETWGKTAAAGWVIGLSGDLGAGKTQLVKGLARGLLITARVHSPTFTLINTYEGGRLRLDHIDLYRLNDPEAVSQAGLEEYLYQPKGVTVVEWIERWLLWDPCRAPDHGSARPPHPYRHVTLEILDTTSRRIIYEDVGD